MQCSLQAARDFPDPYRVPKRRLLPVMFNNPFESFHEMVAEAKDEREQLDRLLTISTPRERLLVAAIAGLLVLLAGWLLFGGIVRSVTVDGVLESSETVHADTRIVHTLVWIKRSVAPDIRTGMPAVIELGPSDGVTGTLGGRVGAITVVPWTENLSRLETGVPVSVHRIEILLDERPHLTSLTSRQCRLVIEVGRQSPLALVRMRRS